MAASSPGIPFNETRAHRAVLIAAGLALAVILWAVICLLPAIQWNAARLAPSFALSRGLPIYALRDSGAHLGWFYGPGFPLWYLPVTLFSDPTRALVASGFLNVATWLLPIAWVLRAAGFSRRTAGAGMVLGGVFMLGNPLLESVFAYVHVDSVCIALQLVACIGLVRATRGSARFGLHVAAIALVAAFWTKLIALALVPALFCWLWQEKRRDLMPSLLFLCAVYGGVLSALVLAVFGPAEVLFNAWFIHSQNRWRPDAVARLGKTLWELAASTWHWWPAALLAWWLHRDAAPVARGNEAGGILPPDGERGSILSGDKTPPTQSTGDSDAFAPVVRLLLWGALWLAPLGLTVVLKSGGNLNSIHSMHYLMLAGLLVLMRALGRPARRLAGVTVLFVLVLALQLAGIGRLASAQLAASWTPDRSQDELLEMALKQPGRCYFPWNPLITIITERRVSPFDDALYCLWVANLEPPIDAIRAAVPKDPVIVYLEPAQSRFALRYFQVENSSTAPSTPAAPISPPK